MKSIVKKIAIFSMVGMMQAGLGASLIEASPLYNDAPQRIQLDDRQREHDRRHQEENERHEREMRRRDHESEREWHDRQKQEKKRHDKALKEIAVLLIGIAIGSSNN